MVGGEIGIPDMYNFIKKETLVKGKSLPVNLSQAMSIQRQFSHAFRLLQ